MYLQIAICDDDECYRKKINNIVQNKLEELGCGDSCIELYKECDTLLCDKEKLKKYDILFLDINFENQNGMTAAAKIKEVNKDYINHVSAYDRLSRMRFC